MPNEIPVVVHKGSNYDYNFIIKELASEFDGQFECLQENAEKDKSFSVPVEKEVTNIYKDLIFNASSFSNLVENIAEGIHETKCKDCDCFAEYESVRDNLIKYKCLSYNKDYSKKLDKKLKKRFKNTFKFSNSDIN